MNKLILISLVIFFAICSKSWAETDNLDGINLHCEVNNEYVGPYKFRDNQLKKNYFFTFINFRAIQSLVKESYPFEIIKNEINYRTTNFIISLLYINKNGYLFNVDRKSLELSFFYNMKMQIVGICTTVSDEYISNSLNLKIDELNNQYKKEREGNKI